MADDRIEAIQGCGGLRSEVHILCVDDDADDVEIFFGAVAEIGPAGLTNKGKH